MRSNDLIEQRVERNLKLVSKTLLVSLPEDGSVLLEEFVSMQESHVERQTEMLQAKNLEVETAVTDLFAMITSYPLDPHVGGVDMEEVERVSNKVRV